MTTDVWVALEFPKTKGWESRDRPDDALSDYPGLLTWAREADLIDGQTAAALRASADADPAGASQAVAVAQAARDTIYRVFRPIGDGHVPAATDVGALGDLAASFAPHRRLTRDGESYQWEWDRGNPPALASPVWPVVQNAVDLLTSEWVSRVRHCASDSCGWLFVDRSRNRSRRWCEMSDCGNREKVRRFRRREGTPGSGG